MLKLFHTRLNYLALLCVLLSPLSSTATPNAEGNARRLAKEAGRAYKNGMYETAANQFAEAFEISGKADYLYDAAISFQQSQRWDQCVGFMGRYLELAPISPKRDRARNARDNCEARRQKSQTLRIETNPPIANIRLGNKNNPIVGTTPLVLKRPPGVLRVFIEKDGHESVIRDVELQSGAPFLLSVELKEVQSKGYLFVDATVIGATVFLNGQSSRLTPFEVPLSLKSGAYQIHITRPGFHSATHQLNVEPLTVHHLQVALNPLENVNTWRTTMGWVSHVLGALSIAGGAAASHYANDYYSDTDEFRKLSQIEETGYVVGGSLIATGLSLLVWDSLRDQVSTQDRNPRFGAPIVLPPDAVNIKRQEAE